MRLRCDPGSGIIFQIIADIRRGQIVRREMLNVSWSNTLAMTSWTWQCHIRALSDPSMLLKCHHLTSTLGEWMKRARIYRVPFPKSLCSVSSAHWTGCWLAACIRRSLCSIWACTTVRPARDGLFTLDCSTVSWMQSKRSNLLDKYTVAWCQFLFSGRSYKIQWTCGKHLTELKELLLRTGADSLVLQQYGGRLPWALWRKQLPPVQKLNRHW